VPGQQGASQLMQPNGAMFEVPDLQEMMVLQMQANGELQTADQAAGLGASGADIDEEFTCLREPRSLSSTAQTVQPCSGSADPARSVDWLTSRVDEAVMRLTDIVNDAIIELREELPRARHEIQRQQAELERVSEESNRNAAMCYARIEALERGLADEAVARGKVESALIEARNELEMGLGDEVTARAELEKAQAHAVDLLDRNLAEETEARCELEKSLGQSVQELREHVMPEVEGIREMAMREMRERMDGQKVLREEVQLQQQALLGLTTRINDVLIEVRTEVPRLRDESSVLKLELQKVGGACQTSEGRLELLEKSLAEEIRRCREAERALGTEIRERLESEETLSAHRNNEMGRQIVELSSRLDDSRDESAASSERLEKIADESGEARVSQKHLERQLKSLQDLNVSQVEELHRKLADTETNTNESTLAKIRDCKASMQSWVETAAVARLGELDKALHKEMVDRAGAVKDMLDRTSHNTERWCQLQAKFDQLLIEVL